MSWLDKFFTGVTTIFGPGGAAQPQQPILEFPNSTVSTNTATGVTSVTTSGGGGGGGSALASNVTMPAVGSTVVAPMVAGGGASFQKGNSVNVNVSGNPSNMTVTLVSGDNVTLLNNGGPFNVAPTGSLPGASVVTVASTNAPIGAAVPAIGTTLSTDTTGTYQPTGLRPHFNVKSYGAKGDDSTDDATAIQAAETARAAANGILYFPPGTYLVGTELAITSTAAKWIGESFAYGGSPLTIIRAKSAIRSCLTVKNAGQVDIRSIEFDGADNGGTKRAQYCVYRQTDAFAHYEDCLFTNAILDGIHATKSIDGYALSSVTPHAGNTSPLITAAYAAPPTNALTFTVKMIAGGSLGTATYQYSTDGVTFTSTFTTPTTGTVSLLDTNPISNDTATGVVITFPAGTYAATANDYWTFSTTETQTNNDSVVYDRCWGVLNGKVYATSGSIASFTAQIGANAVSASGTVATTNGSRIITGTGTSFSSLGIRAGDFVTIGTAAQVNAGTAKCYQITNVNDDTNLQVGLRNVPTANASTLQYAISVGHGHFEELHGDNNLLNVRGGLWRGNAGAGVYCNGLYGPTITCQTDDNCVAGVAIGLDNGGNTTLKSRVEIYSEANLFTAVYVGSCAGIYVSTNTGIPSTFFVADTFSKGVIVNETGIAPVGAGAVCSIPVTTGPTQGVAFTSAGFYVSTPVISQPATLGTTIGPAAMCDVINVQAPGTGGTFTAHPAIVAGVAGQKVKLINGGSFTFTLSSDAIDAGSHLFNLGLTGATTLVLAVGQSANFIYGNFALGTGWYQT